jgi:hypothetical protein
VSPALLEAIPRSRDGDDHGDQAPLFEELRRATESRPDDATASEPGRGTAAGDPGERQPRSGGNRLTLEHLLERTWEGLLAAGAAECVVCGGALERTAAGGSCRACGSRLS